jgi:molecular chaperone GrpE
MNQKNDPHDQDDRELPPEGGDGSERGNAEEIGSGLAIPAEEAAALVREVDDLKSKLLRSAADYQNMIRRSQTNIAEAREQQLMDMAKSLVTVMDHFDRALEVDQVKVDPQTLLQGLKMVHDELLKTLEKFGIQRVEANAGEEFDPTKHAALMRQKADGVAPGHVAAQFQPGYVLNDRTIRPVQVSVAE